MPKIHPTAVVDPQARLADDVEVGPYCVIEADVEIGPGCRLAEHAIIRRHTALGRGNLIDSFCVLGSLPQDLKFDPATDTRLLIGDRNVFREGVTISRATRPGGATTVGGGTYWMLGSHAGHDATICDGVILANGAAVAGHATVGARTFMSAHAAVHQYCRVGEGVMARGYSGATMHVPPFTILREINVIAGLNVVGMRRAGFSSEQRRLVKDAYRLLYRSGLTPAKALAEMDARDDWDEPARKFREFVRQAVTAEPPFHRGLCAARRGTNEIGDEES